MGTVLESANAARPPGGGLTRAYAATTKASVVQAVGSELLAAFQCHAMLANLVRVLA